VVDAQDGLRIKVAHGFMDGAKSVTTVAPAAAAGHDERRRTARKAGKTSNVAIDLMQNSRNRAGRAAEHNPLF
jgi:hypothetical protein